METILKPAQFNCASMDVDLDSELIVKTIEIFVDQRLTRCSKEQFYIELDKALLNKTQSYSENDALKDALFAAVLNEMVIEATAEAIEKAKKDGEFKDLNSQV